MEALGAAPVLDDGLVGGNAGLLVVSRPAHTSTQTKGQHTNKGELSMRDNGPPQQRRWCNGQGAHAAAKTWGKQL